MLFYFCTDLCICAVRRGLGHGLLADLTAWTLGFLRDTVAHWVHDSGGWGRVLAVGSIDGAAQVTVAAAAAAALAAAGVFYYCLRRR